MRTNTEYIELGIIILHWSLDGAGQGPMISQISSLSVYFAIATAISSASVRPCLSPEL